MYQLCEWRFCPVDRLATIVTSSFCRSRPWSGSYNDDDKGNYLNVRQAYRSFCRPYVSTLNILWLIHISPVSSQLTACRCSHGRIGASAFCFVFDVQWQAEGGWHSALSLSFNRAVPSRRAGQSICRLANQSEQFKDRVRASALACVCVCIASGARWWEAHLRVRLYMHSFIGSRINIPEQTLDGVNFTYVG